MKCKEGEAGSAPPDDAIPQSFEPGHIARHSRTVGAMRSAPLVWAQCGSLSIGGNEILILIPGAHMRGGAILDILRADGAVNPRFFLMTTLCGVGALILHRYDVQRVPIWTAFGWFAPGTLLGYWGEHL